MKLISEEQVHALLEYLVSRPYAEVFRGVAMLENLPIAPVSDDQRGETIQSPIL